MIDARVRKILEAKRELGLFQKPFCAFEEINTPSAYALKKRLFQEAITVVCNGGMLPLKQGKIALIEWGQSAFFKSLLEEELSIETISLNDPQLFTKLQEHSRAIVALSKLTTAPPDFGLGSDEKAILGALAEHNIPITAVVFGTPYSLAKLPQFSSIVAAYENEREAQEAAAEVALGRIPAKGKLPICYRVGFKRA
jgi:beta-N-acetylhexosaminidase